VAIFRDEQGQPVAKGSWRTDVGPGGDFFRRHAEPDGDRLQPWQVAVFRSSRHVTYRK
jgi:hypothetical protein